MAIYIRSKKSKITKKEENEEQRISNNNSCKTLAIFIVFLVIFIWSSNFMETIMVEVISSSCSSRKTYNNEDVKEVQRLVSVQRSYTSYTAKTKAGVWENCEGRRIYVYDELPTKFNKDLLTKCDEVTWISHFCTYLTNQGLGEPLEELGEGWYNTHQYSLESIFHSRVLNHPCRVHNAYEAKLFYVPFYGGFDVLRWHFKDVTNVVKDSLSSELVDWLELQATWRRNLGLDHVLVLGKISWDFRRLGNGTWGNRLLEMDELQRPMKLLIERNHWEVSEVGVPHPTHFHPGSDQDILELQARLRGIQRLNLVSFAGASRNDSGSIRSRLIDNCTSNPGKCTFLDFQNEACLNPVPMINLFMNSEFCLQPPGDSPTRKSFFDSLVVGCIPVVFDPLTAYYQYAWHLPDDCRKYSVYVDKEGVRSSKVNVVEMLMRIPLKKRKKMRKYIIDELMPRLVYSHPRAKKLELFEDAFSISMNNLLERLTK